jgi:hypothetical protein
MSYCCGQPNYMGFNLPAAAMPAAALTGPLAPFLLAISLAMPFLNKIGSGRKEADEITPTQNKIGDALSQLDQILGNQTLSASDLQQLHAELVTLWNNFLSFLYQPAFTADGDTRASDGARATIEPQVQNRLDRITSMLNAVLGRPSVPTMLQGAGTPSLEFRISSDQVLPQAGFLQPGAVGPNPAQVIGPVADSGLLMKLALAAGVVFVITRR